jgi:hypothetical protein
MIFEKNPEFNSLIINEIEKSLLPFSCVCDLIPFEDRPFLQGSRVIEINFKESVGSSKIIVNSSGFQVAS